MSLRIASLAVRSFIRPSSQRSHIITKDLELEAFGSHLGADAEYQVKTEVPRGVAILDHM